MKKSVLVTVVAAAGVVIVAGVVAGIAVSAGAAGHPSALGTNSPASTPAPTPTAAPVPTPSAADVSAALALAQAGHDLAAGTDGFAEADARTALDAASTQLVTDAPKADLPTLTARIASVRTAADAVRTQATATANRVLNEETTDAEQSVRDSLYVVVVAQQSPATFAPETVPAIAELIAKTRAAQDSQAAYNEEQAREAAGQASGGDGSQSSENDPDGDGSDDIYYTHVFDNPLPGFGVPPDWVPPDTKPMG